MLEEHYKVDIYSKNLSIFLHLFRFIDSNLLSSTGSELETERGDDIYRV
jgi:hypothetical protein